jgi:hypothetical protein
VVDARSTGGPAMNSIRWIARGVGLLLAVFWLLTGIGSATVERGPLTVESAMLAVFMITLVLGVFISWRRERIGGTLLVICGAAFSAFAYFSAGRNKGFAMLVSGGPVMLSGMLFLASWWRGARSGTRHNDS